MPIVLNNRVIGTNDENFAEYAALSLLLDSVNEDWSEYAAWAAAIDGLPVEPEPPDPDEEWYGDEDEVDGYERAA